MDLNPLITFACTALLLTIVPGLDTAMVLRTAAVDGKRSGVRAALGIGLGCLAWGTAAAFGLGMLLAASEDAFLVLKTAGAIYLLYLGFKLLLSAKARAAFVGTAAPGRGGSPGAAAFRRGLTTNLLNPKVGIFYVTLLPQFIPAHASAIGYALMLTAVHVILAVVWFVGLSTGADALGRLLRHPAASKRIDALTGCACIGFGAELMLARS